MKQEDENKKEQNVFMYLAVIVGLIVVCFIMFYATKYSYVTEQGMLIALFGILATFVVIGNYTQVTHIRQETKENIKDMSTNVNRILADMYDSNNDLRLQVKDKDIEIKIRTIIATYLREQDQRYSTLVNELFYRLTNHDYIEMIKTITSPNGIYSCTVINPETNRTINATVRLEGDNVVFRNRRGDIMTDINVVNGQEYYELEIADLVQLWIKIRRPVTEEAVRQAIFGINNQNINE